MIIDLGQGNIEITTEAEVDALDISKEHKAIIKETLLKSE